MSGWPALDDLLDRRPRQLRHLLHDADELDTCITNALASLEGHPELEHEVARLTREQAALSHHRRQLAHALELRSKR